METTPDVESLNGEVQINRQLAAQDVHRMRRTRGACQSK